MPDKSTPEIHKIIVLSTGHLSAKEMKTLLRDPDSVPLPFGPHGLVYGKNGETNFESYGWLFHVPNQAVELLDIRARLREAGLDGLESAVAFAADHGCEMLIFDSDAPPQSDLPYYGKCENKQEETKNGH